MVMPFLPNYIQSLVYWFIETKVIFLDIWYLFLVQDNIVQGYVSGFQKIFQVVYYSRDLVKKDGNDIVFQ